MLDKKQLPFILAGVFLMTLQPLLVALSQNSEGKLEYSPMSSTLLSELGKMVLSVAFLFSGPGRSAQVKLERREVMEYSVPALIYFINNNLNFIILTHVSATTFQLLSQLKTVFTGLLFRFFLSRHLTFYQYVAIWQLACGTAVSQLPPCLAGSSASSSGMSSSTIGFLMSIVSCILSAFGGIYSEKLLKNKPNDSIHWQNIQLYAWGVVFNLLGMFLNSGLDLFKTGFFKGYNFWAWVVVLNNALNGLAISAILKYADNIARVYAHACAMLVTMVLSIFLFGQTPTPQLVIAVAGVAASAVQYSYKPDRAASVSGKYQPVEKGEVCENGVQELATVVGAASPRPDPE
mmetsp:Transcript_11433/g.34528  ORF Transcript_11433/g.34528 Transcript_11433/m.34528 type:complete len:348 (-) Transcript_11433:48-1091(-)